MLCVYQRGKGETVVANVPYDVCEICGRQKTGFTTLYCPDEEEHKAESSKTYYIFNASKLSSPLTLFSGVYIFDSLGDAETYAKGRVSVTRRRYITPCFFVYSLAPGSITEDDLREDKWNNPHLTISLAVIKETLSQPVQIELASEVT